MKKIIFVLLLAVAVFSSSVTLASTEEFNEAMVAVATMVDLANIPNQPKAVNPAHNKVMQEQVARIFIQRYAARLKEKSMNVSNVHVGSVDMDVALHSLNNYLLHYIDSKLGNNDGHTDADEFTKYQQTTMKTAGFQVLLGMWIDHKIQ